MSEEKKSSQVPTPNLGSARKEERENFGKRVISSVSNLASGLGDRDFLHGLSSIDGKGSSSRTAGPSEARNEIIKTHYELIPSGAIMRSSQATFTSRPTLDFDSHGTNIEISALPRLESASESLSQGNLSSTSQAQHVFFRPFRLGSQ